MDKKLVTYFVLAYGLSWLVMVPLALQGSDVVSGIPAWVHMLAAFGPFLASVGLTAWFDGKRGLKKLWSRMTRCQIGGVAGVDFYLWVRRRNRLAWVCLAAFTKTLRRA